MTDSPRIFQKLFAFTDEQVALLQSAVELLQGDAELSSAEHNDAAAILQKLEAKPTHLHIERNHQVRLVAPYVKKKGCEVPLAIYETPCGMLYARTVSDFASRMVLI